MVSAAAAPAETETLTNRADDLPASLLADLVNAVTDFVGTIDEAGEFLFLTLLDGGCLRFPKMRISEDKVSFRTTNWLQKRFNERWIVWSWLERTSGRAQMFL